MMFGQNVVDVVPQIQLSTTFCADNAKTQMQFFFLEIIKTLIISRYTIELVLGRTIQPILEPHLECTHTTHTQLNCKQFLRRPIWAMR